LSHAIDKHRERFVKILCKVNNYNNNYNDCNSNNNDLQNRSLTIGYYKG